MANNPQNRGLKTQKDGETIWQQASTWLSRTLAVTLVMVLPGVLGAYLDKRWETTLLAPLGFGLGLILGTVGLVVLAKKLTPKAGGQPLAWDEPPTSSDESEIDADKNGRQ